MVVSSKTVNGTCKTREKNVHEVVERRYARLYKMGIWDMFCMWEKGKWTLLMTS